MSRGCVFPLEYAAAIAAGALPEAASASLEPLRAVRHSALLDTEAVRIGAALDMLQARKLVTKTTQMAGGRPTEVWRANAK